MVPYLINLEVAHDTNKCRKHGRNNEKEASNDSDHPQVIQKRCLHTKDEDI